MNKFDDTYTGRKIRGFSLSDGFLAPYRTKPDPMNSLGRFVFKRKYAREREDGNLESWFDVCVRVVEGVFTIQKHHVKKLHITWDDRKAQRTAQIMFERMFEMKWMPPGRGLWAMGTDMIDRKGSAPLNNCGFTSTKDIATDFAGPFCWLMDFSMLGVGCGGDTKGAGTITLKRPPLPDSPWRSREFFLVPDTREGWVDAVRTVLECYEKGKTIPEFDYSLIRPEGSPLAGFGGKASGADPLKELILDLVSILDKEVGKPISSTAIVDIFNAIGRGVVSGGIRRVAEIMFGDPNDSEFARLKNRDEVNELEERYYSTNSPKLKQMIDNHPVNKYRWASNNSIMAFKGMDYSRYVDQIAGTGEPGFIWLENMRKFGRRADEPNWADKAALGCNPCGEQTLEDREICNLVETFPAKHDNLQDYIKTLKVAYLYAKSVTLVPTHDPRTNAVMMRNRRIGCSMSGIVQAISKFGRFEFRNWCESGYQKIQELDHTYSDWLCVPRSKKTTSVKPSGTVSLLANATPGIHYAHSEYYIRNVRIPSSSPMVDVCRAAGYPVEPDAVAPKSCVVSFPIKEEHFTKGKADVSLWEQFMNASDMQKYWSDNQVSITCTFRPEEVKDISTCLEMFESDLKSVSLLPLDVGSYKQPPYITISREVYEDMVQNLKELSFDTAVHEETERFCDGDSCALV